MSDFEFLNCFPLFLFCYFFKKKFPPFPIFTPFSNFFIMWANWSFHTLFNLALLKFVRWYTRASKLFSGIGVTNNFYNSIRVKDCQIGSHGWVASTKHMHQAGQFGSSQIPRIHWHSLFELNRLIYDIIYDTFLDLCWNYPVKSTMHWFCCSYAYSIKVYNHNERKTVG